MKNVLNTAVFIILKPSDTWKELKKKQADDAKSFLSEYIYPVIGLVTVATFIGVLLTRKVFDLQIAIKETIMAFLSLFTGFFLASCLLNEIWHFSFHRQRNLKLCQCFVGYASSLLYVLHIAVSLLPDFFFLHLLVFYTFYIAWEGSVRYMEVDEPDQFKFAGISMLIIILSPMLIEFILGILMPGLKV